METIDYFLRRYREEIIRKRKAEQDIEAQLAALEAQLRGEKFSLEDLLPQLDRFEPEAQGMAADQNCYGLRNSSMIVSEFDSKFDLCLEPGDLGGPEISIHPRREMSPTSRDRPEAKEASSSAPA